MQKGSSQPGIPEGTALHWSSTAHRQSRWDWRAVGNFVGGGTGTGLLVAATLLAPSIQAYRVQAALGLGIIGLGLLCIMAKLGRPTRALNIFRHVQSSWMTREAFAMPTLFGCGALSLWQSEVGLMAIGATLSALFFLYCQARILEEAKGIPAWSEQKIVPLILATGLAEGAGLAALCAAVVPGSVSRALAGLLLVALGCAMSPGVAIAEAWTSRAPRGRRSACCRASPAGSSLRVSGCPWCCSWPGCGSATRRW